MSKVHEQVRRELELRAKSMQESVERIKVQTGGTPSYDGFDIALLGYVQALESRLDPGAMFEFIKHGDQEHQDWLREALEAWVARGPKPEPRGLGRHGAEIARLQAELLSASSRLGEVRNDLWGMFAHYAPTVLSRHPDDGWLIAFCQAIEAYIPTIDRAVERQVPIEDREFGQWGEERWPTK